MTTPSLKEKKKFLTISIFFPICIKASLHFKMYKLFFPNNLPYADILSKKIYTVQITIKIMKPHNYKTLFTSSKPQIVL